MNKIKLLIVSVFLLVSNGIYSQTSVAGQLAQNMAQKMKDTLSLSSDQKTQLYVINVSLHNQKTAVRQQYSNADSLRKYIQRIEGTRDSLYNTVITSSTYTLYLQKKRNLVKGN